MHNSDVAIQGSSTSNLDNILQSVWELESLGIKDLEFLLQEYNATFAQQLQSGIIELVPEAQEKLQASFYLPHHGVVRQDKETTKLRIVFDGSAKTKSNFSLNDCLAKGPNLTPLVFDILLRFRLFRVGLIADVEKAFHQISIERSDWDMLHFLWFNEDACKTGTIHYRFVVYHLG